MAEGSPQYKSSSEQERITRQINRDLERSSTKKDIVAGEEVSRSQLSQSTRRALDNPETREWVKSILDQKAAQLQANNFSLDRTTVKISSTSREATPYVEDVAQGTISASASGGMDEDMIPELAGTEGGADLPEGALGDLLYNNGTDWVVLSPPETAEDQEKFFYWNGTDWRFSDVKVFDICENGTPKQYRIPAIEVV
jgi:hypothetical protein